VLCLTFQGAGIPVWKEFNSNVAAKCESLVISIDLLRYVWIYYRGGRQRRPGGPSRPGFSYMVQI